jgi:hypothetical protein
VRFVKRIELTNFTCTFGKDLGMLDLFEEVVWPAFQPMRETRQIKDTQLFFLDTQLITLDNGADHPIVCLSGRLVKNTKLRREQIFRREEGLIEDYTELETAPSSLFALMLHNHRLLYVREVAGAPDISTFRTTSQQFLNKRHREFILELVKENREEVEADSDVQRETKKSLVEEYPYPDLRITPLTDKEELRTFIDRFDVIQDLTIKLLRTNREDIDNDEFWDALDKTRGRMGSKKASLHFSNKSDGLDDSEVYAQCNAASELGNSEIKLNGLDPYGGTLRGNNEDFQLSLEVEELSRDVKKATPELVREFSELVDSGVVESPRVSGQVLQRLHHLISRLL